MTRTQFIIAMSGLPAFLIGLGVTNASAQGSWVYSSQEDKGVLNISYKFPYLDSIKLGQRIMGLLHSPEFEAKTAIVDLDFKLNNTTAQNKFATSVDFKIIKNQLVNEAIPYMNGGLRAVFVGNLGWAPMEGPNVSYGLAQRDQCTPDSPMPNTLRSIAPTADGSSRFTWKIEKGDMPSDWSNQAPSYVCVLGYLNYKSNGISNRVPFATVVQLETPHMMVAPFIQFSSEEYDLSIDAGRSGYVKTLPISNLICANSAERFIVHFKSNRSATFDFDVSVNFTDGTSIPVGSVHLDYFRPPQVRNGTLPRTRIRTAPAVPLAQPPSTSVQCPNH
jgi:hypothetical protein